MSGGAFGPTGGATPPRFCPCGSGRTYPGCCGRLHDGAPAATAESLMRSRYAAFALGDAPYLLRTWHPRTRPESLDLDPRHRWTGLEVLATQAGGPEDETGVVVYRASARDPAGVMQAMTEEARFARRGGRWVYVDGDVS